MLCKMGSLNCYFTGTSKSIAEWVHTKIQSQKILCVELSKVISLDLPPLHSYREEWIQNTGGKVMTALIQHHLSFVSHLSIKHFQTAVSERVHTPTTQ
jgi:hypothetical protein